MADEDFTLEQAMAAQRALRDSLGLDEERFPMDRLVGMISDEIQGCREAGRDDDAIAAMIEAATGKPVTPDDIRRHYASEERRRPGAGGA